MAEPSPVWSLQAKFSKPKACLLSALVPICLCLAGMSPALGQVALSLGQVTTLTCERAVPGGQVNCTVQRSLLSLFPQGESQILDLRSADVSEVADQDGDLSHRIELVTASGAIPLTPMHYPGSGAYQREAADRINRFVQASDPGTITVVEQPFSGLPTPQP